MNKKITFRFFRRKHRIEGIYTCIDGKILNPYIWIYNTIYNENDNFIPNQPPFIVVVDKHSINEQSEQDKSRYVPVSFKTLQEAKERILEYLNKLETTSE